MFSMARTALFAQLRRSFQLARSAARHGEPAAEHAERTREAYLSRRDLLRGAAAVAVTAPLVHACGGGGSAAADVGIVGAGIAGLHCAYRLQQRGVAADVFDAWNRVGGRTFTARGMLDGGQLCELGGELVDTGHDHMRALATEFGLTIDDRTEAAGIRKDTYFIGGRVVPESEIVTAFTPVAMRMDAAVSATAMDPAAFAALDGTSLHAWLNDPANMVSDPLRTLLDVAYVGEYGRETTEQSVFNMLALIDYTTPDPFRIYGDSDEIGHLHLGSESIAENLHMRLTREPMLGHRLIAMRAGTGGRVRLVIDTGGGAMIEREYGHVVLTLPFLQLRHVDIDPMLAFTADKTTAIQTLGYGQNTKLMLQFSSKPWRAGSMASGSAYTDNHAQTLWETSIGQSGNQGVLTHFAGGNDALTLGMGTADSQASRVLPLIDAVFPGTMAAFNGRALRMDWQAAPFHGGSYACYLPGQYVFSTATDTLGIEGLRQGNVHFAGEHTSVEAQGYMEGAAESGLRAANEILGDMGMAAIQPLVAPRARRSVRDVVMRARRAI
jgi:monoamine oxidase